MDLRLRAAGANLRPGEVLQDRHGFRRARAASRTARIAPRARRCVPCEKFSRTMSAPAAISASSVAGASEAGPSVAMIFVCLTRVVYNR